MKLTDLDALRERLWKEFAADFYPPSYRRSTRDQTFLAEEDRDRGRVEFGFGVGVDKTIKDLPDNDFFWALSHMIKGNIAECQGLAYRIKDDQLEYFKEYDDPHLCAWVPATLQTIFWAIKQDWLLK